MLRSVLAMAVVAVGVTGVLAQSDAISERKALMKKNSQHSKAVNAMVRGEAPFDAAAAGAAFNQWHETAQALPKLFPDNSKSGGETRALPKIWSDKNGFNAQIAVFAKAAAEGKAKATTLEGLKAAFPAVTKACNDCHEDYRAAAKKK
ncbi:MAG: cytochrome c [Hyphomicrobiales bacterium]|nr:cytochrome c [Hyphomicrobiales bacterium]